MMFDGLYQDQADQALNAKAMRPPEPDPNARRFSVWGLLRTPDRGVRVGTAEALASTADTGKATTENWLGGINSPLGRIPVFSAVQALAKTGMDVLNPTEGKFTSEVGTSLRNVAQDITPDPQTTHAAESAVFNLFRVGSKAITAAATLGNIPGAFMAGAEEGLTQADELARQGVDINTRTKVGAVTAATNAVGFALPAAGKTWLQTGGLALAGGPASFMVQNAATREILQNADYSKLADQYDPFDPVGLALSTVVPLGFGAMAMRGAKGKGGSEPDVGNPITDAAPKVAPPDDVVDAARVTLVRQQMDAANPVPERMDMADAHVKAYTQAMDQMAAGERVQVGDTAPADAPKITEWAATVAKAAEAQKQAAAVTVEIKPDTNFLQAKTEAGMVGGTIRDGALHINYAEVDPAMRGQGEGIKLYSALIDDALSRGLRVFSDATVEAPAVRVYEALQRRGYEVKRLGGGVLEDGTAYGKGAKDPAFEIVGKTEQPPAATADAALQASIAMDMKLRESGATVDTVPDLATFAADSGMALDNVVADAAAPKGNAFIAWLKSVGGVSYAQKFDIVGERGVRGNYAGVFTKKGQNIDTLVESAVQAGYLSRADVENPNDVGGTRALAELIRRATTGEKIQTIEQLDAGRMADMQTRANMDAVDAMEAELRALGVDPSAAKGNADVLGAYLSEHRTALVNRKLADIDAETKADRIAIGEAYDLTPKQVDDTARIALAQELDENAFVNAAMDARDEVDFLNRIEEIIRNAPGSRKANEGRPGTAQDGGIPARNGEAATPRAEPAANGAAAAAADQPPGQVAGDTSQGPATQLDKMLADIAGRNPTALDAEIPIEFDADGKPAARMTVRDYIDMVKREASQDAADANLIEVAATCFLTGGL